MPSKQKLVLAATPVDSRPSVEVFGGEYKIRAITRSVQRALDKVDKSMQALMKDDNSTGDALVTVLADAMDALLAPTVDGQVSVKNVVVEKWEADELSLDGLRRFADELQEQAVEARTT